MGSVVVQNGIGAVNKDMREGARAESNHLMMDSRDAVLSTLTRLSRSETPEFQQKIQGKRFKVLESIQLGDHEAVVGEVPSENSGEAPLSYLIQIGGSSYFAGRTQGELASTIESVKRALDPSLNARSPITKILASNEGK